jgi:hypothetical protein
MDYQISLELAEGLEAIRKHRLKASPVVKAIANLIYKYGVTDLELLNEVTEGLLAANSLPNSKLPTEITPQDLFDAELLTKDITFLVERIRLELFGKREAPFSSWEEAEDWLREEELRQKGFERFGGGEKLKESIWKSHSSPLLKPADSKTQEFEERKWLVQEFSQTINKIRLWDRGRALGKGMLGEIDLVTPPPSHLALLVLKARELSEQTAIDYSSLLMHILANTKIVCEGFTYYFRTTNSLDLSVSVNKLEITSWGRLNPADRHRIFQVIKKHFGEGRKRKEITAKHLELYRLVDRKGGAPVKRAKGMVAFWKQVMLEWNKTHPEDTYTTWKGVKRAYDLLMARQK